MIKWLRTEIGIRCLTAFSIFLTLTMAVFISETISLVHELKSFSVDENKFYKNETSIKSLSNFQKSEIIDSVIHKKFKRFLSIFLILILASIIIVLLFSIKQFIRPLDSHDLEKDDLSDLDNLINDDIVDSADLTFNKVFDALQKVNDLEDSIKDDNDEELEKSLLEDIDIIDEKPSNDMANSYNKMMEALQKINELEKKHTIELAKTNELLENEITERERAEKEIRDLSRRLIDGTEEAQKKLAQDLHDEFGQTLAALHMGVETLWNSMPDEMNMQKKHIDDLISLIEQLGDKIRSISSDLRPDLLDDLGLVPTLEWYIKEFTEQREDIQISFQASGFKKRLASEIELVLYRIFQESFNNIVKHSQAKIVNVILTYSYPKVILMIKDNGIGFNQVQRSSGIGLIGMRERAVSLKGHIDIRSDKSKGTTIRVELPVSKEEHYE